MGLKCCLGHQMEELVLYILAGNIFTLYRSICWYLWVLPVLHRPAVVDIGVNTI